MQLLLVGEDESLHDHLRYQIKKMGYLAHTAHDADSAIKAVSEHAIDAAIIDLNHTNICRVDLIHTLRQKGHTFPVLILTARDCWENRLQCLEAGANDYIVMPFNTLEVKKRLMSLAKKLAPSNS